jgi:hypothetical protein
MTLHDAAMTQLSQWWQRAKRSGYAYANGAWLHGASAERYNVRECLRILFWGLLLPLLIVIIALFQPLLAVLLFCIYPIQYLRLAKMHSGNARWIWAASMLVGKFAETLGVLRFLRDRFMGRRGRLIEYKANS